jgi:hypothetical protein
MELHEIELKNAVDRLHANGRNEDDFIFKMSYLPPDPEGGVMYTMRYAIEITNRKTSKSLTFVGGIGLDWVSFFEEALEGGEFD